MVTIIDAENANDSGWEDLDSMTLRWRGVSLLLNINRGTLWSNGHLNNHEGCSPKDEDNIKRLLRLSFPLEFLCYVINILTL